MMSAVVLLVLLCGTLVSGLHLPGLKTDLSTILPNGNQVFANGHWWPAVLNTTWRGEPTSGFNSFGDALVASNFVWTNTVCNADSDGDGFSNGEELGDPDCVWSSGSSAQRTADISHPGIWSSTPSTSTFPGRLQTPMGANCAVDLSPSATTNEARESLTHTVTIPEGTVGAQNHSFGRAKIYAVDSDAPFYPATVAGCYYDNATVNHWHVPSTWPDSVVPAEGANVTIPINTVVMISSCSVSRTGFAKVTIPAGSALVFNDAPILFRVKDIVVEGSLWIGTSSCPIKQPVTIEFSASSSELGVYSNGIMAMGNGVIEMHGAPNKLTWSRLTASAVDGSDWLVLQDAVEWSAGEDIVITTTSFRDDQSNNQNEVRRIVAVDPLNRTRLQIDTPLVYFHYGGQEYQAEVALLWRSITLRGAENDEGFGGHTMAAGASTTYRVFGVRAENMGQTNIVARYPFHIHLARENGNFSFIQQVACVGTYYRCAVVHGTNFSQMRKNVAFNITGHAFYLEDGSEMWNNVTFNIASFVHSIGTVAAGSGQNGFKFTEDSTCRLPADHAAVCFYISNAHNYIVGNAASGGWSAYQFPIFPRPIQLSKHIDIVPYTYRTLRFDGNSAHSAGHNWPTFGACVYHGGKLWENEATGLLEYDAVRDNIDVNINADDYGHLIQNTRLFLCNLGFLSWGKKGDIQNIEGSDNRLTAFLLADGGIVNGVITARTENHWRAYAGESNDRINGFRFYDASARNIYSRIKFRNFWEQERSVYVDGWSPLFVGSNRDVEKTTQISGVQGLEFENVDYGIKLSRRPRELSSTWCFNVIDWDGSLTNRPTCEPMIVGSYTDWWHRDDSCHYNSLWPAWICPRLPGVEVVALEALNNDLFYRLEWSPKENSNLNWTQAQRDQLFVGHVSHFGTDSHRRFTVTRNSHLATGWSGIGWYLYLETGTPTLLTLVPRVFPKGTFILLAISYPADTIFSIRSLLKWGSKRQDFTVAGSREAVLEGGGTTYHFDGKHLYLRISQSYRFTGTLSRDEADVHDVQANWHIVVEATTCASTLAGFCSVPAQPDAPTHLATGKLLTPYINVCASSTEFEADVSTTNIDHPYHCSLNKTCTVFAVEHRPSHVADWCGDLMRGKPFSESCWVPTCNWTTGKLRRIRMPVDSPCSPSDGSNGENTLCDGDGVCKRSLGGVEHHFELRRLSQGHHVSVSVQPIEAVDTVEVYHPSTNAMVPLRRNGGFFQSETVLMSPLLQDASFRIKSSTNASMYWYNVSDWNANSQTIPKVTVVSTSPTDVILNIDPINWIESVKMTSNSHATAHSTPGTTSAAANEVIHRNRVTFSTADASLPSAMAIAGANVGALLTMKSGMQIHVSLPCLGSSRDTSMIAVPCKTQAVDVFDKPSACRFRLINQPATTKKLDFNIAPAPVWQLDGDENFVFRVVAKAALLGADVEFSTTTNFSFNCKHGDIDNLKNIAAPVEIEIFTTHGQKETHRFVKETHFPQNYQVLECVAGIREDQSQKGGVDGQCNAENDCVTTHVFPPPSTSALATNAQTDAPTNIVPPPTTVLASPTPVPATPTPLPATPTPVPATPTPVPATPTPMPSSPSPTTEPSTPTPTETSSAPSTSQQTTLVPTTTPTTVADTPTTQTARMGPTTGGTTSAAPTTLATDSAPASTFTTDTSTMPSPSQLPTAPTTPPARRLTGRLKITGANNTVHLELITKRRTLLEDSLKLDISASLKVPKTTVVIHNMTIGSLIVDFSIDEQISISAEEMQSALDILVAESIQQGRLPENSFDETQKLYRVAAPEAPAISLSEGTIAASTTSPPSPTTSTDSLATESDSSGSGCGTACFIPITVCVALILLSAAAFAVYRQGISRKGEALERKNDPNERSAAYSVAERPHGALSVPVADETTLGGAIPPSSSLRHDFATSRRAQSPAVQSGVSRSPRDQSVLVKSGMGPNAVHHVITGDSVRDPSTASPPADFSHERGPASPPRAPTDINDSRTLNFSDLDVSGMVDTPAEQRETGLLFSPAEESRSEPGSPSFPAPGAGHGAANLSSAASDALRKRGSEGDADTPANKAIVDFSTHL